MFKQVKLVKNDTYMVTMIPSKYAKINKVLRIKGIDGWVVSEIYGSYEDKEAIDMSHSHKTWAKSKGLKNG
jgi:hypothetical protein